MDWGKEEEKLPWQRLAGSTGCEAKLGEDTCYFRSPGRACWGACAQAPTLRLQDLRLEPAAPDFQVTMSPSPTDQTEGASPRVYLADSWVRICGAHKGGLNPNVHTAQEIPL